MDELFRNPQHPYTQALLGAIPRLRHWPDRLTTIEGAPPSLTAEIVGCPFAPRCPYVMEKCVENPPLLPIKPSHAAAFWVAPGLTEQPSALPQRTHG